jgi:O-antigen/teichoic acid export membrane protein
MALPILKSNSLFNNSFSIFIIRFFPSLANLLVMIWFSRSLSPAVYGQYQNFWIQLLVLSPVISMGVHVLLITYSKDYIVRLAKQLSGRHYALYFLWAAAISLLFAWLQRRLFPIPVSGLIPLLFVLLFAVTFILESFLIVCREYKKLIIINLLYALAFCVIHRFALQHALHIGYLFLYLLCLISLRFAIYGVITISAWMKRGIAENEEIPQLKIIRSLWLHLALYDILQVLFSYIDKFIISLVLTAGVSAIYYNGSQNIPFLPLLLSAAGSAVLLQLAGRKGPDGSKDAILLMNQSGRALSCIVFPLFFFLVFFRYELIIELFTEKYLSAMPIFLVSVMVLPVRAYNFTTILQQRHKGAIINTGAIADLLLACALMYPLYRWLGLPGVALSFVITTYLQAAFYLYYSAKLLNTSPLNLLPLANWTFKLILLSFLFIVIHYGCNLYFSSRITLLLGACAFAIVTFASLLSELKIQRTNVRNH